MKKSIIVASILFSFVLVYSVGAQEVLPNTGAASKAIRENVRESIKDAREGLKQNIKNEREVLKTQREATKMEFETKREEAKNRIELEREGFKQKFEARKEEAKNKFEADREVMKTRLLKIKDERKKQAVEKIANQIKELNERTLNQLSEKLDKIGKVLGRITSRADKAESRGLDVSSVRTAVLSAEKTITDARESITLQAAKTYTVLMATSTDGTLKKDVGGARQALHADLVKVKDMVKSAHEATRNAATTLAKIKGVDDKDDDRNENNGQENNDNSTSTGTSTSQ